MIEKLIIKNREKCVWIDCLFIALFFLVPLVLNVVFKLNTVETRMCFIGISAIWMLSKPFYSSSSLTHISLFDIGFFGLFILALFHFYFYSNATFHYYMLWLYMGYFFIFYMFRWALHIPFNPQFIMRFILFLIVLACLLQSLVGLLQYFEIIKGRNEFFKLLGSFSSPNFLGAFLGFGFLIMVWYLFVKKTSNTTLSILGMLLLLLFGGLIILSNSRGAWLGILGSLMVFVLTSAKFRVLIKKQRATKLVFGSLLVLTLIIFGSKYLYALKPESVDGRAFTTQITLQEIAKHPLEGHGLFSFAGKYNRAKADYFMDGDRPWNDMEVATYAFSAFNDYLLIAFELGIPFLLIALSLIVLVVIKIKITPETRIGLGLFVNLCLFALFNSPLHSVYIMSVGIFGFSLMVRFGELNLFSLHLPHLFKKAIPMFIFLVGCFGAYAISTKTINQKKISTYTKINSDLEAKEIVHLYKSTEDNLFSEYALGRKLYDNGFKDEGISYMEKAFQKSSAPRIGKQLAFCYMDKGDYKKAEDVFKFNISVEPYRYEPRMDLLMLFIQLNRHKEIVKLSRDIVNLPIKVPSEKVNDYKKTALKHAKNYARSIDPKSALKGSLSNLKLIKSKILNKILPYRIYLPPIDRVSEKLPVIYINDGDNYIKKAGLPKILDSLIVNNVIEPVSAVFLEPRNKKENWKNIRQELFLCNPAFGKFFADEFIPAIEKLYPISNTYDKRTILGVSFGGLAAAYLADRNPGTFKNVIMQSPAFHPCKDIYKSYSLKPKKDFKMYLSYGTGKDTERQDIPFIKVLRHKGYDLKVDRVAGADHEWVVWHEQLEGILIYYFGHNPI